MPPVHSRVRADTQSHIQSRDDPGFFYDRDKYGGRWWGPDHRPTWVHEIGVSLDTPAPPFVPQAYRANSGPVSQNTTQWDPAGRNRNRSASPPRFPVGSSSSGASRYGGLRRSPSPWERDSRSVSGARRRSPGRADPGLQRRRSPSPRSPPRFRGNSPGRYNEGHFRNAPRYDAPGPSHGRGRGRTQEHREYKPRGRPRSPARRGRDTRPKWVRTQYPPDVAKAVLGPHGHPMCPLEVSDENDDSDYGSDTVVSNLPDNWKATETLRVGDAKELERVGRKYDKTTIPDSPALGPWQGLRVRTVADSVNVLRWVARTENSAYEFMYQQCVRIARDPTILRTPGEIHLLRAQPDATKTFWLASTGNPRAPPRAADGTAMTMAPATAPAEEPDPDQVTYLGDAQLDGDDTIVISLERPTEGCDARSGSHTKLGIARRIYDSMPPDLWPLGFRISEALYPAKGVKTASAYWLDVAAWYTINALAPRRNRIGSSIERSRFLEVLWRVLSVAGTFNRIAQMGEFPDDTRPLEHYPFNAMNIAYSHVVCWLVQHGISREGNAVKALESYGRARRNKREGRDLPSYTEFTDGEAPHNAREMLSIGDDQVIHWRDLEHAPPADGTVTAYPRKPSAAMDVSSG
ncbi:hypothetical protein B0H15DRAFT_801550 [Mycena belliarum]|uniref:Uncharacterized protein n=1 Tax=Mycena belliarum TaxID=1033014 RepID=A0AAD6U118_9AGAR|nr:hypothetical protein B0H15DRAFT_801550 [Mycena belliae]